VKRPRLAELSLAIWLGVPLSSCERESELAPVPPPGSAAASAPALVPASAAAPASGAPRESAPSGSSRGAASVSFQTRRLTSLELLKNGMLAAKLGDSESWALELSSNERPLAHRGPVAYERVASHIAPGLVPRTVLRVMPLAELLDASDAGVRTYLKRHARVLADGRVRGALSLRPPGKLERVELSDLAETGRVFRWESALVRRELPAQADLDQLSSYQMLLAVDYLVGNLERRAVFLDEGGKLLALEGNRIFSARPVEGAIEPLSRLSRHITFSRSLAVRLGALDSEALARDLTVPVDEGSLLTPKQLTQVEERRRAIQKLISSQVSRRGEDKALALP